MHFTPFILCFLEESYEALSCSYYVLNFLAFQAPRSYMVCFYKKKRVISSYHLVISVIFSYRSKNSTIFSYHAVNFKILTAFCINRILLDSQDLRFIKQRQIFKIGQNESEK